MSDPMYEIAKFKDYVKTGAIALFLSFSLYGVGFRANTATTNPESSYVHIKNNCQDKKELKKYLKGYENLSEVEKEWFDKKVDYEKRIDLNRDGLEDIVELHSRAYLRDCDIKDWHFKDNYLRVHLSGESDRLSDWRGGLPVRISINLAERKITTFEESNEGIVRERITEY